MTIAKILLVAIVGAATMAGAQAPVPGSPDAAVTAYMADLKKQGMLGVSRHLHPDELSKFKGLLMPWLRKDAAKKSEAIHGLFGPDATLAKIEAMSGAEFMDGFMRIAGEQLKGATFDDVQILGSVKENDIIHVVTRAGVTVNGVQLKALEVVSVRRAGDDWKLLLSGELEGMAAAIAAQP
jgi:hypothetical protein